VSPRTERALFMFWGWQAVPWVLGAVALAFRTDLWFGAAIALLVAVWFCDMGATTCSRCGSYGTGRCGTQSWIVPLLWKRKSNPVSRLRVRLHYCFDVLMMAAGIAVYAFFPALLPFFMLWLALGWWVVYLPRKHHGLLNRLDAPLRKTAMSLPVLPPDHPGSPCPGPPGQPASAYSLRGPLRTSSNCASRSRPTRASKPVTKGPNSDTVHESTTARNSVVEPSLGMRKLTL
jgi:hypothetical protein